MNYPNALPTAVPAFASKKEWVSLHQFRRIVFQFSDFFSLLSISPEIVEMARELNRDRKIALGEMGELPSTLKDLQGSSAQWLFSDFSYPFNAPQLNLRFGNSGK